MYDGAVNERAPDRVIQLDRTGRSVSRSGDLARSWRGGSMSESTDDRPEPVTHKANTQLSLEYWRQRSEESRAHIARLTARLRGRDRRIERLELAIARTVVMHHVWASRLERKLERSPDTSVHDQPHSSARVPAQPEYAGG